jgi:hypothetical protein
LHWQAISHRTSRWFYISLSWGCEFWGVCG